MNHLDATAPHIRIRAQMGKHVIRGSLIAIGGGMQLRWEQTGGTRGDARRRCSKHRRA
jgi:hypothetical protein